MELRPLELAGVIEIIPKKIGDARGYFAETYSRARYQEAGIAQDWLQDNQSFSREAGVLRGLHFQVAPFAQDKLIRVLRGSIIDVAVDIRKNSPTFRRWVSCTISAAAFNQLLVPKGFAHGFVTLSNSAELLYKTTDYWYPEFERSLVWDDPDVAIEWPAQTSPILAAKDRDGMRLAQAETFA